uniref:Uncharacterized protein n=1 Tax=Anguilla anguilla TaxID=7936 RepID=A0A0E9QLT2_ANGAN
MGLAERGSFVSATHTDTHTRLMGRSGCLPLWYCDLSPILRCFGTLKCTHMRGCSQDNTVLGKLHTLRKTIPCTVPCGTCACAHSLALNLTLVGCS